MASRYRKIDPRIWTDEKFRRLTGEQQRIALYIITAQSNRIGLFCFSPAKACEDLATSPQTFQKGFENVCRTLNWEWDPDARVLYLPTWWKYNQPENPNNVIGNLKDLDDLPGTPLLKRFCANIAYLPEGLIETFAQTLAKRYPQRSPKCSPAQEQEQEQEQETDGGQSAKHTPEDIRTRWNAIPGVKPCKVMGTTIRDRVRSRLADHPELAWWEELFQRVQTSDFLCGRTNGKEGPFHASLDWVLGPKNLDKILAGNYDSMTRNGHGNDHSMRRAERIPL
jgi:hypothetical protein